jgi:RNA polymerase-binding transcription factor DksA
MTPKQLDKYRTQLTDLSARVDGTAASLEEQVRTPTGGQASGNLSNTPMHLGDVGTEVYTQELNATLLENEAFIRDEARAALDRIARGAFGRCENCGAQIPAARLDALPYARHCVRCAAELQAGRPVNLNEGRPQAWPEGYAPGGDVTETEPTGRTGDRAPFTDLDEIPDPRLDQADVHAAGTPGGGTAVGGLAGTTFGGGEPGDAGLEDAMGSGNFDVAIEGDEADTTAYSGPSGGAVGGTPAGKRAAGGKVPRGASLDQNVKNDPVGP